MKAAWWAIGGALVLGLCACASAPPRTPTAQVAPVAKGPLEVSELSEARFSSFMHQSIPLRAVPADPASLSQIRRRAQGFEVRIYLGTWCHDSALQVPRFLEILAAAGVPASRVRLWAMDRDFAPRPEGADGRILRLPTLIVRRHPGGLELGRIEERPRVSLETDLASFLK